MDQADFMDTGTLFISYLFSYGKLVIPGLGKLILHKKPAKIVNHEQKIYGPEFFVEFIEDTSIEESPLESTLSTQFNWKKKKARKKLLSEGSKILNKVLNLGEAEISNFGKFKKNEGVAIEFELDQKLEKLLGRNYPTLDLPRHLQSYSEVLEHPFAHDPKFQQFGQKQKIGWFFPLLALIASSILIACILSCFMTGKHSFALPGTLPEKGEIIKEIIVGDTTKTLDEILSEEDKNSLDPEDYEDPDISKEYEHAGAIEKEKISSESIEEFSLAEILDFSAIKRSTFNEPCMIVTGSYKRRDLLNAMVTRLDSHGYNIYIEQYGDFFRTAVIFDCKTIDKMEMLNKIRSSIETKAWIL